MSFSVQNNRWELIIVVVLIGILALLGVLQYRWLGEISEAERERRQINLTVSADNLTNEFDREITRIFVQLRINPIGGKLPENYHVRYEQWRAATLYPRIVSRIYFASRDERGELQLSAYDTATQRFEPSDWSGKFAEVRHEIEQNLSVTTSPAADIYAASNKPINDLLLIPASTVDLSNLELKLTAAKDKASAAQGIRRVGYTIVALDDDYLRNELLPSLVASYFPRTNDSSDYKISITERGSGKIIYQTSVFPESIDTKKAVEQDFFRVKLTEIGNVLPQSAQDAKSSAAFVSQARISSGIVISSGGGNQFSQSSNQESSGSRIGGFGARWQFSAAYVDGSLDSLIGRTRLRNSLISGAILLLLGASGLWLLVLSNRSRVFASRQKDFIASVSHELRTPLAVIRSLSENLADGIVRSENQVKEYGAVINDEEHRLSAMVEQMLGFAAQNSSGAAEKTPQNVGDIIEMALADHRRELERGDFVVKKNIAPGLPYVAGNFDALRRAIGNLIGNAVKYSAYSREIGVTAQLADDGKFVEINIEDFGAGIDAKELPDVFKLFYRGKTAIEGQTKGSGIGLNLVKQIVEAHGGTISAISEINRGSIFAIKLPVMAGSSFIENDDIQ